MIQISKTSIKYQKTHMKYFQVKLKLKWMFLFKLVALFMTLLNCPCCNFIMIVLILILTAQILFISRWTRIALILHSVVKIEDLIKPELKEHYLLNKNKWFPRDDTKENAKFDKRSPGPFKVEYRGKSIISLCPK